MANSGRRRCLGSEDVWGQSKNALAFIDLNPATDSRSRWRWRWPAQCLTSCRNLSFQSARPVFLACRVATCKDANAALSGIDIYKVGLNVLVFALTPIIVTPIIERLSLYIEYWGNYVPDIYDVGKALLLEQDSDEAAAGGME